ncbi:MAG: hypothetical protein ACI4NO_07080 [Oxalobacter sp.]
MDICAGFRTLAALLMVALALFFSPAQSGTPETIQNIPIKQTAKPPLTDTVTDTSASSTVPSTKNRTPSATQSSDPQIRSSSSKLPEGWEKLAENHIEVVYTKLTPHDIAPNITGIEVRVTAQTKELFDYAEGVAMADCDIREVFPVSGDIYDVNGNTINPMHIPLLNGLTYIRAFPQEAYDALLERLCSRNLAGNPADESGKLSSQNE